MYIGSRIIGLFSRGSYTFYFTDDGWVGTGIRFSCIDIEKNGSDSSSTINNLVNIEDERTRLRLFSNFKSTREFPFSSGRDEALNSLGRNVFENFVFIERKDAISLKFWSKLSKNKNFDKIADEIITSINVDWFTENELIFNEVGAKEIRLFSLDPFDEISLNRLSMDFRGQTVSVVRLWEPTGSEIHLEKLAYLREGLGPFHLVSTTIRKKDRAKVLMKLKKSQKQTTQANNMVDATRNEGSQIAEADLEFNDTDIYDVEMNVIFYGSDRKDVENRAIRGRSKLLELGYFMRETNSQLVPFTSSMLGSRPNYAFIEDGKHIDLYIPFKGRAPSRNFSESSRAMAVSRGSWDVEYIDLFSPKYANYSAVILGKMGSGKSVLLNTLVNCMLHDEKLKVMLVDVRGSFKRQVNRYRNNTYNFKLKEATGLNPFRIISNKEIAAEDKVEILKEFIKTLIKKDEEKTLDPELLSEVETCLKEYCLKEPGFPGVSDFVKEFPNFPRVKTLKRWATGGVFEHVFQGTTNPDPGAVITYYNFEEIFTAADTDISRAVIAAVKCDFNANLISKQRQEKLVFIADETPFFVKESFDFFKLTNKNVRKLNGSMVLAAQSSSDLVVNGDSSLIDNVDTKFLFSVDSKKSDYKELFNIDEDQYQMIANCEKIKDNNSAFVLKDPLGFRQCFLELTPKEYWEATSKADDVNKIESLKEHIPGLTDLECYKILEAGK